MRFSNSAHPLVLAAALLVTASACNRDRPPQTTDVRPINPADVYPDADTRVRTAVQAKYYSDDTLRGHAVDVLAENGVVTLRGSVASDAARQRAEEMARSVAGVSSVNNQLEVATAAKPVSADKPAPTTGTAERDREMHQPAWITTKIQAQYFVDPDITPWNIDVTTVTGGVVTLEGEVDSQDDRAEAVRIARETEGVTRVVDRLRVGKDAGGDRRPEDSVLSDGWLTAKIQAKYFVDDLVKARHIDVNTASGVVTLKGVVVSEAERRQAVALARNTDGVSRVTDELRVDAGAATDPRPTGIPEVQPIPRPDGWITMKIQAQYFLDTDVKGHEIDVDTRTGVVTLKGTVRTEQQKQEAEQIARTTDGVKRVVNQIKVAPGDGG
jgi:osmotically-inducible protein OsmY